MQLATSLNPKSSSDGRHNDEKPLAQYKKDSTLLLSLRRARWKSHSIGKNTRWLRDDDYRDRWGFVREQLCNSRWLGLSWFHSKFLCTWLPLRSMWYSRNNLNLQLPKESAFFLRSMYKAANMVILRLEEELVQIVVFSAYALVNVLASNALDLRTSWELRSTDMKNCIPCTRLNRV